MVFMFFNKFGIKSRNVNIIGFSQLVLWFIFYLPVLALYLHEKLFTATNVAVVFSVMTLVKLLLEIPSGTLSDLFGRKKTLILGQILFFGLLYLVLKSNSLVDFVIAAVINGIGSSLISGNDKAIVYDTLLSEKKEHHYKKISSL